ncbi:alpha-keto acid decarboxylase family protein [Elongatibacter sediminis]|uniref:Thiamine pyrophosphate-binding protein n=1 Tax=Elongatibacter sediminis TaxID=3119006 RepID=A0AAW9RAF4_9GAMM
MARPDARPNRADTVSHHLLRRLKGLGAEHLFGIPGDYILPLYEAVEGSGVTHVATCNELNAGYAADGYARLRGLGAVAVTYGPGSLSVVNAAAGALAEGVPLLIISGGPALHAYVSQPVMHHLLPGRFDASLKVFEQVTAHARILDDPESAAADIDAGLKVCLEQRKPVYLEIPQDVQAHPCGTLPDRPFPRGMQSDPEALELAVSRVADRLAHGGRAVILPGHEVQHAQIEPAVTRLLSRTGLRAASVFSGKADFLEQHRCCIGAYQGAGSLPEVRKFVESAETVVFLGCVPSDFNLGGFTAELPRDGLVHVLDNAVVAGNERFVPVAIKDFVEALTSALTDKVADPESAPTQAFSHRATDAYEPVHGAAMTNKRLYDRMAHFLRYGDVVLADAGCAINATQVQLPEGVRYIASGYWASIGMGFGAALGAGFAAGRGQRVIALEGDGSFQMTAQELSSMVRYGHPTIVFVVNNKGYTAERLIHDGPFNDIADWRYHLLPVAFGGVQGEDVHTEGDLERALSRAAVHAGPGPLVVEVHIDPWDASEAFRLMSVALRSR